MKKTLLVLAVLALTSCVNQMDRLRDAQKKYPKCIVQPTTSLLARDGYEIMVEDTITNQIYVLDYYAFSTTKIFDIRNIK
jgi:nucleoside-specific outer membrane channel protein Tsx